MCPDARYLKLTRKKPEDIFPTLRELTQYAGNEPNNTKTSD